MSTPTEREELKKHGDKLEPMIERTGKESLTEDDQERLDDDVADLEDDDEDLENDPVDDGDDGDE